MRTIGVFKEFVEEIKLDNSRNYKISVLTKWKNNEVVRAYLNFIFNPFVRTGISAKKFERAMSMDAPGRVSPWELMQYLQQHNTGTDEDLAVVASCDTALGPSYRDLLRAVVCKDLPIGIDVKTINKVIPNFLPEFSVQLAQKYFEKPERLEGKHFAITTKIDGGRIIAIKENGQVAFYTRAGQLYEGLVDLEREMAERLPDNFVLDGEITLLDYQNYDSKHAYKQAMKITRADNEKHGVKMLVFDGMPLSDWKTQTSSLTYLQRRQMLDCMSGLSSNDLTYFELLPILYLGSDTSKVLELLESETARGQEGVMINVCDAYYDFTRTWNLMKVKKMNTLDLEVVGYEEGSGRLTGTLGALHVRYKNGNIVKVGSGFSDELRALIWLEPSDFVGKIAEIQWFEETTNADGGISLRFPVFKDFRPDKNTPDF